MNKDQKAAVVDEIAANMKESQAIFAVDYRGISVPQAAELRGTLREADASFRIVKNTLTDRAAEQAGVEGLRNLLDGPTALTFVRGDAATAAKAIADFTRANSILEFKGGVMDGAVLSVEEIKSISRLPSRNVLYGQLVGMVASPLTGLVRSLGGLIGGLAIQLQAIADQGLVAGEAPAEVEAPTEADAPAEPVAEAEPAAEADVPADQAASDTDNEADAPAAADEDAAEAKEDV